MNWNLMMPEIIITFTAVTVLVLDFSLAAANARKALGVVSLLGVIAALISTLVLMGNHGELFGGLFLVDPLALFFKVIFLIAASLILLISFSYLGRLPGRRGEFYWLALTALLGMMVTAASRELITIYVGVELISLSFYALVGFHQEKRSATEAALKYFILGSFAIGLWLYGATLIYGITGSTDLIRIAHALGNQQGLLMYIGIFLLIAGFAFKMGLAPFHMWVPDAYQGAPTPITAFLAVGSKAAAFAVFMRVMGTAFGSYYASWSVILGIMAIITMTWGNVAALRQTNIKRLMAYSGIAHAGYTLIGIVALGNAGSQAVMFYLFGYMFATVGVFAAVVAFSNFTGSDTINDYAGLRWRNPFLAFGLAICLLSLAGIPPLAGFFGKFYLFWGAIQKGGWMLTLVIIAGINSAISLFYYVNIIRVMYFIKPTEETSLTSPFLIKLTLVVAMAGVILAMFYFQPIISSIQSSGALSAIF
ncbi:MAG: NADH-quinone oxidoreductase subunit N [Bacillota bacterium]